MRLFFSFLIALLAVGGVVYYVFFMETYPVIAPPQREHPLIRITEPQPNDEVSFPLKVSGEARGNWYFEGDFPLLVFDKSGEELAGSYATAQGEWMTENFVPFEGMIESIKTPSSLTGLITFKKDNPSGLPEHDDQVEIPVRFESMTVLAYFPNKQEDPEAIDCGAVHAVERTVPKSPAVARAALNELIKGPTALDQQRGFYTSINEGVEIVSLSVENGVAKVTFSPKLQEGVGGSCLVTSIREQIRQTMLTFPTVDDVQISVEGFADEEILQP